jgi:hypothetical protein
VVTGASDGLALDAGQTLCSAWYLLMWHVAEELESTGHSGVFNGVASDTSDVHFRAQGAYWTVSDTACGASDEEHRSVQCELN